ncbi:MAG TPA: HD domain-containing protein, partial [Saccharofermentans sp.]|nr:HD domain-containing protein [Saccharofermentans sp.]
VELSYAALFHDICKPQVFTVDSEGVGHMKGHPRRSAELFASWAKEHKLSKKMTSSIETLIRYHDTFNDTDQVAISRMMAEIPNILFDKLEILQEADILAHANYGLDRLQKLRNQQEIRQNIISKNICVSIKQLAISGDDMIKLGYSGKQIREKLEFALEAVITGKANNSKEELLSILTRESLN